jgi:DNA invertase Pin-like site-specific DNA recombinase
MPEVPVPVAWVGRTSTLEMQDPVASLRRQYRVAQAALPAGFQIVAWYWDIESGALDLADRSHGQAWQKVAAQVGIPRDGGVAELLADAAAPVPKFAAATCEEIERVARDTLASLTVEKELAKRGIPIFAADEPASIEGASPTTILVRRVRQGVADYYRLQMLGKCWNGLIQHALDGWNIGTPPYGYAAEQHPHPAGIKAAQKRTRTRLIPDPVRGPVVTLIFDWRVNRRLSVPTIAWKLNADPAAYPPPGNAPGWAESTVSALLRNPKYTGHMVYGRTRKDPATRKTRPVPPGQWTWSPDPTHEPLTPLATWQAAQAIGAERGNVRDTEKPTTQPGSRYMLRSRIRHQACQRRMYGVRRPSSSNTAPAVYTYYHCPYNPSNPRHTAAHPDHQAHSVSIREETIVAAITGFLDQYVFSHDRAAQLAGLIPATDAEHAETRARQQAHLTAELARIRTAMAGLMTELARLGADTSPATQDYRQRIQEHHADLHAQRTTAQAQLDELTAAAVPDQDPTLLDELPYLTSQLDDAPAHLVAALLDALDIQVLYRPEQQQATIWATLTDTTPATITALFNDPRIAATVPSPRQPAETSTPGLISDSAQGPIGAGISHDHEIRGGVWAGTAGGAGAAAGGAGAAAGRVRAVRTRVSRATSVKGFSRMS